jgi:hypothetical protein
MSESASVVAMRQLVGEADRSPSGLSRSRRHALERLAALAERRTARRGVPAPAAAEGSTG